LTEGNNHKRKEKPDILDRHHEIKNFCRSQDTMKKISGKPQTEPNIHRTHLTKDLYLGYLKKLLQLNDEKTYSPFTNRQRTQKDTSKQKIEERPVST